MAATFLAFEIVVGDGILGQSFGFVTALIAFLRALKWKDLGQHLLKVSAVYAVLSVASFLTIVLNAQVARHRAGPVISAVERFHAERGRYPETLVELVPRYLPSVPRAGFTWRGRRYGYDASRPQVYHPAMMHGMFFYDFPTKKWLANE